MAGTGKVWQIRYRLMLRQSSRRFVTAVANCAESGTP
jgi:hypothetical protein